MNKMAARVLTNKLGSPSYGNSKLKKREKFKKTIVYQSLSQFYGEQDFSDMVKNGTIFSSN